MMEIPKFSVADYVVFGVSIAISLGIGLFFGVIRNRKQTPSEYLIGGRKMNVIPVAMSLVVTFESSILVMGVPAEVYLFGFQWILMSVGWFLTIIISAVLYAPLLHALNITSAFEYLELRYQSKLIRTLGCFLQILYYLIYMGVVLFGPAIALQAVSGFPLYATILVIAFVAIAYTTLGGMKAVVWTDFFQFGVLFIGMIAVIVKGSVDVGGLNEVFRISSEHGRLNFSLSLDPTIRLTVWIALLGQTFRMSGLLFNQASIQRISSLPTSRAAVTCLMIAAPWFIIIALLACMQGLVAFAYYTVYGCDPKESHQITNENQLIVVFVLQLFKDYPGLAGLFISALFSASLSTLSSGLGSISANAWEDIIKPLIGKISDQKATMIARAAVVVAGVTSIAISALIAEIGGTLVKITNVVLGVVAAPLTGIYLLGLLFPCGNAKGAAVGAAISLALTTWLSAGSTVSTKIPQTPALPPAPTYKCYDLNITSTESSLSTTVTDMTTTELSSTDLGIDALYTLSPFLYGSLGIAVCVIVGVIASLVASLLLGTHDEPVDRAYITPYVHRIWSNTKFLKGKESRIIEKVRDFDELRSNKATEKGEFTSL